MKKTKKDIEIEAVKAIVSGELFLEEAMHKYYVKDRRTMIKWLKKWHLRGRFPKNLKNI